MKEKFSENKEGPLEELEGVDMEKLFSGIGHNLIETSPPIARVFLRQSGYTEKQIEQIESATPQIKQSPEDSQKTIDLYRKFAAEFEKKGEEKIAKAYRGAAEKLGKELENKLRE